MNDSSKKSKLIQHHLLLGSPLSPPGVPLLGDGELDTLATGQRHPRLAALTNDEDIRYPMQKISERL
jgi:hypothetical protein